MASQRTRPLLKNRSGCATCRLRKKKCDEVKPICGICQRLELHCTWSPDTSKTLQLKGVKPQQLRRPTPTTLLPRDIDLSGFQDNICITFTLKNLFGAINQPIGSDNQEGSLSFRHLTQFADPYQSKSWTSLQALGRLYFGLKNSDRGISVSGLSQYQVALDSIGQSISTRDRLFSGDMISAIIIVSLTAMMVPNQTGIWASHMLGVANIVQSMGPAAFQSPRMRTLLENNRYALIATASVAKQPTFLCQPEWKSIPWSSSPKDDFQRLLDIYADVPSVTALFTRLAMTPPEGQSRAGRELVAKIDRILARLHQWRLSVDEKIQCEVFVFDRLGSPLQEAGIQRPAIGFDSLATAFELGIFNLVISVLCTYLLSPPLMSVRVANPGAKDVESSLGIKLPMMPHLVSSIIEGENNATSSGFESRIRQNVAQDEQRTRLDERHMGMGQDDEDKEEGQGEEYHQEQYDHYGHRSRDPLQPDDVEGLLEAEVYPCTNPLLRAVRAGEEIAQIIPWTSQEQYIAASGSYLFGPVTLAYLFFARQNPVRARWFLKALKGFGRIWQSLGPHEIRELIDKL